MKIEIRPAFDEAVMNAELPVRKAAAKMLSLLHSLTLQQLWSHTGLNFEKLHGMIEPASGEQLYSLRVTGSARAITCILRGPTIVLVSLHVQHDKAYRK
ncbi:hypothetical protein [Geomonas anaerohicana]|uniref:Uncharacterized protein n=1 Tax=Geomonas anaerohicana TaxID=2798583 RepID=A0ABS0YED9_9BACT|nr:hypothetical protein [Geomonas anaerohicana]MBJ6750688.1 hypothetical protein [Geomonas anaerohicana]